jgi:DNA-binding CsgD family transcriptional regulator
MLRRDDGLMLRGDRLAARSTGDQNMLHAAIARAASAEGAEACALLVRRTEGPPYEVSVASVNKAGLGRHVVVLVTDRTARDPSLESRVRALYGLTQAEAEVAVRLTEGASVERLSTERGVAIGTVRTQIKSIAAKMGCSRQSELVANIGNLPRLHEMR